MAFATPDDVAVRLGRSLTDAEEALAEQIIEIVEGLIRDAAGEDSDWTPDPVPALFRAICIDKVLFVAANPNGLTSENKTIGASERRRDFAHVDGVKLTDDEVREIKRLVNGSTFLAVTLVSPYSGDDEDELDLLL